MTPHPGPNILKRNRYLSDGVFIMRTKNSALKLLLSAFLLSLPLSASADTFSWSLLAAGVSGSGTFTATPSSTVANADNITGITGFVNGVAVSQLIPATYNPLIPSHYAFADGVYFNYDNLVYTFGTSFDVHGLLFELSNGIFVNLFDNGKLSEFAMLDGDPVFDAANLNPASATISADVVPVSIPEPSTFLLLGSGLLTAASAIRRKLTAL